MKGLLFGWGAGNQSRVNIQTARLVECVRRTVMVYRGCQLDGIILKESLLSTSVRDFLGLGNVGDTKPWAKVQDCI